MIFVLLDCVNKDRFTHPPSTKIVLGFRAIFILPLVELIKKRSKNEFLLHIYFNVTKNSIVILV